MSGDRYYTANIKVVLHVESTNDDVRDLEQAIERAKQCLDIMAPPLMTSVVPGMTSVYDIRLGTVRPARKWELDHKDGDEG